VKDFVAKVGTAHERIQLDEEDEDDDHDPEDNSISRKVHSFGTQPKLMPINTPLAY
jgi:hypothetical protein